MTDAGLFRCGLLTGALSKRIRQAGGGMNLPRIFLPSAMFRGTSAVPCGSLALRLARGHLPSEDEGVSRVRTSCLPWCLFLGWFAVLAACASSSDMQVLDFEAGRNHAAVQGKRSAARRSDRRSTLRELRESVTAHPTKKLEGSGSRGRSRYGCFRLRVCRCYRGAVTLVDGRRPTEPRRARLKRSAAYRMRSRRTGVRLQPTQNPGNHFQRRGDYPVQRGNSIP